jgi:undecaprenyl diphosphate synthase
MIINNDTNKLIDKNKLPKHLAIIMDGNGRWAQKRGLARSFGHKEGVKAVKEVVSNCIGLNIPILTLFAFSTENWKRSESEVTYLMKLFGAVLDQEKINLIENNIRVNFIGRLKDLPKSLNDKMNELGILTKKNNKLILNIAINYGGRAEIVDAVNSIILQIYNKEINNKRINEKIIRDNLYTKELPDPDLLIRTGGEMRISNFLIWQIAYTEFWVSPVYWPDFNKNDLIEAIVDYQKRTRNFGGKV